MTKTFSREVLEAARDGVHWALQTNYLAGSHWKRLRKNAVTGAVSELARRYDWRMPMEVEADVRSLTGIIMDAACKEGRTTVERAEAAYRLVNRAFDTNGTMEYPAA